jgi:hypothetical protein
MASLPAIEQVPKLVEQLYALVAEFEALFPGRRFTPDGHLVGSIGEVVAAHRYGLTLTPASTQGHDAISATGIKVEVKATQGSSVALREEPHHLLVLQLGRNGHCREVYNGPGSLAWNAAAPVQGRNGQRSIRLARLVQLMQHVPPEQRVPAVGS